MNIAINGFGRIGRNFLRTIVQDSQARKRLNVSAINIGPAKRDTIAHMFKYDTIMGTYPESVSMQGDTLRIGDYPPIKIISERDPLACKWGDIGIAWVVDASGHFTERKGAQKHLDAGAKKVLISAPAKGEDISIVPGVNHDQYNQDMHNIISLGSCTTNAFIPMVKIIHDAFGITRGFMTTIHAYTNTQVLLDVESSDLRRARAAALNIIPTTTGASKMLGKILPELEGVISAMAIRVPVAKISLIDLTVDTKQSLSVDQIHQAIKKAEHGSMKGIVSLTMEPLVSSDFSGTKYSVIFDGLLTEVQGSMAKLFGWYDNEWGYSERLKSFLLYALGQARD